MDKDSLFSTKSSKHSVQEVTKSETTKDNIFNIESEHKRLVESESETGRKTSIKSPITKVQTVTRLSSSMRSHDTNADHNHYDPTESPTVSQFTNRLSASVPNQPEYVAKHEELEDDNEQQIVEEMETLAEGKSCSQSCVNHLMSFTKMIDKRSIYQNSTVILVIWKVHNRGDPQEVRQSKRRAVRLKPKR